MPHAKVRSFSVTTHGVDSSKEPSLVPVELGDIGGRDYCDQLPRPRIHLDKSIVALYAIVLLDAAACSETMLPSSKIGIRTLELL